MIQFKKKIGLFLALSMSASLTVAATCSKTMNNNVVNDDLHIPANASCVLNGSVINGDIKVAAGSSLTLNSATVNGEIEAKKAKVVKINKSAIQGDVDLEHTSNSIVIDKTVINGDLSCKGQLKSAGGSNVIRGEIEGKCR